MALRIPVIYRTGLDGQIKELNVARSQHQTIAK